MANTAPTFTQLGLVTTNLSGFDQGYSVTVQADGKILVAGSVLTATGGHDFGLVRYNIDGSLDTTFDEDGKVTSDFDNGNAQGYSVAVQADGKILVAGNNGYGFGLARYNTNGSLDLTFDSDGKVTTDFGRVANATSITVQADGKILLAGSGSGDFGLARYNTNGSLDVTFDSDGKVTTDFGGDDKISGITIQADGKILAVGGSLENDYLSSVCALARYNTDGSLDTTFDEDGKTTTDFGTYSRGNAVTVQENGKILVAVNDGYNFGLAHYDISGDLIDTTFDDNDKITTDFGTYTGGHAVTVQGDGKILVAGIGGGNFGLARYNTNGSLDVTFDSDGKLATDFGGLYNIANVAIQPDGKILVVGSLSTGGTGFNFGLMRYNASGSLDASFTNQLSSLDEISTLDSPLTFAILDSDVHIYDAELVLTGSYSGAILTLARHNGAQADDVFLASGTLSPLITGAYLSVDNTIIGRVATNTDGTLRLVFNNEATQSLVDKAMQSIAYKNSGSIPPVAVQIDWTFSDNNSGLQGTGGALCVTDSSSILITFNNKPPEIIHEIPALSIQPIFFSYIFPIDTFSDANSGTSLTYTISMNDGTPLPPWIYFDSASRSVSGSPSVLDTGNFDFKVTAIDNLNETVSSILHISVDATGPIVSKLVPVEGSANFGIDSNIVITFNETIKIYDGEISLKNDAGITIEIFDLASSNMAIHNNELILNPNIDLAYSTNYHINIDRDALKDLAGNSYSGLPRYNFTTIPDTIAPVVLLLSPADGSSEVDDNSNIVITFSENIQIGSGTITLKTDIGSVESFDIRSEGLSISGSTLTINPTMPLMPDGTTYYLTFDSGSIRDLANNVFVGSQDYHFTTVDATGPIVSKLVPVEGSTNFGIDSNIVITFDETIKIYDGEISLKNDAGITIEIFDLASSNMAIHNNELILNPNIDLAYSTNYHINIDKDALKDLAGNSYSGLPRYDFTTIPDTIAPVVLLLSPADGSSEVDDNSNIVITFSENIQIGSGTITLKTDKGHILDVINVETSNLLLASGATLTINPPSALASGTHFFVTLDSGSVKDMAGNAFAGISDYNFTTSFLTPYPTLDNFPDLSISDMSNTEILSLKPYIDGDRDNKVEVYGIEPSATINEIFQFTATAGSTYDFYSSSYFDPYNLVIYDQYGNAVIDNSEIDDPGDMPLVSGGPRYSFDTIENFVAPYSGVYFVNSKWHRDSYFINSFYYLSILEDTDTSPVDLYPPNLIYSYPSTGTVDVSITGNIIIIFDENIQRGNGSVIIKNGTGENVNIFDAATSSNLSISGATLIIDPAYPLTNSTNYYVILEAGSIKDLTGNIVHETNALGFLTAPFPSATVMGTDGNDILSGGAGNDALTGGLGDDIFNGGDGVDTIILSGLPSQYHLNGNSLTGIEGTDTVTSIEQFRFGNLYVSNLDANALTDPDGSGPADSPAKDMLQGISDLYVAYFNRAPDVDGLMYWFREVMNGSTWTLPTIAQSFTDQAEYRETYPPGLSNREFISAIYQNLFDRAPDAAGWDYWENDLNHGVPRDVFIYSIIQGAYAPSGSASDKALLNNKHDVSLYYSEQLASSSELFDETSIDQLLNRVTADAKTVGQAEAVIDYVIDNPVTLTGLINDTPVAWEAFWV